jgi:hypothetical protein
MAYKLIDKNGFTVTHQDLQDKGPWCGKGASFEDVFIQNYGPQLGLAINPEKKTNKYAADLFNTKSKNVGDLKTQNTPFFKASSLHSINPQYAVTFNGKDYTRYLEYYPTIEVYFWVDWLITKFEGAETIEVKPMEGVWKINFADIKKLVGTAPMHNYRQRVFDNRGNAKESYVFDLGNPLFEKVI